MLSHIYDLDDVLVENLLINDKVRRNPKEYLKKMASYIKNMPYKGILNYVLQHIRPKNLKIEENSCIISNNPFAKEIAELYFPNTEAYSAIEFEVRDGRFTGRVIEKSKLDIVKDLLDRLDDRVFIYTDGYTGDEIEIAEYLKNLGKDVSLININNV